MEHLSPQTARDYLMTMSKSKARNLKVLGTQASFVSAMNDKPAAIVLHDAIEIHAMLLDKVGNLTATEEEKAGYKYIHMLILKWAERIESYYKTLKEIEEETRKAG